MEASLYVRRVYSGPYDVWHYILYRHTAASDEMMNMVRSRTRNERGAALAEAALVTPFVLLMIFAVIWAALLFRTYLTVSHGAASGARAASISGNAFDADYAIIKAIKPSLSAVNKNAVNRIIVYPATSYGSSPSADCLATGAGCNVYKASDLDRAQPLTTDDWPGDGNFPATSRIASGATPQLVGVYVEIKPGASSLLLPAPKAVSSHKVLRLEARSF